VFFPALSHIFFSGSKRWFQPHHSKTIKNPTRNGRRVTGGGLGMKGTSKRFFERSSNSA
jgi:hypothetical protein